MGDTATTERVSLVEQAHAAARIELDDHEARIRVIERTLWKAAGVVTAVNAAIVYFVKHIP